MLKPPRPWTAEEKKTVSELWLSGCSGGFIAAITGRSRNSIMGFVHREGLKREKKPKITALQAPIAKETDRKSQMPKYFEKCQWLEGDPRFRHFCNLPVERGAFCKEHADRCYLGLTPPPDWEAT